MKIAFQLSQICNYLVWNVTLEVTAIMRDMRGINKVKNTIIIYESDFGNQQLPATSKLPSIGREALFLNITHRTSTCLILRIMF